MHSNFRTKMGKIFTCVLRQSSFDPDSNWVRRKMVIVGDGECGKTCLVTRMSTGGWVDNGYMPTVFETEMVEVHTGEENVELVIYDTAGQEDYDRLRPLSYHDVDVALICFSLAEPDSLANVSENWSPEIRHFCGDIPIILVGNKKDLRTLPASQSGTATPSISSLSSSTASSKSADEDQSTEGKEQADITHTQIDDIRSKNDTTSSMTSISASQRPRFHVHAPVKHSEGAFTAKRIGAMAYFETSALTGENVEELLLATTKAAVLGSKKSRKFKPFTNTLKSWRSTCALEKR